MSANLEIARRSIAHSAGILQMDKLLVRAPVVPRELLKAIGQLLEPAGHVGQVLVLKVPLVRAVDDLRHRPDDTRIKHRQELLAIGLFAGVQRGDFQSRR